jgi:DNA mismatch endonuclease (patch repair protein)
MSKIRSKWTAQERKAHNYLKGHKVKHKMHPKLLGNPDILLIKSNTVVFLNGCFWHKCPKCYKEPKSRREYWLPKIKGNVARDSLNKKIIKQRGYNVLVLWEHSIKKEFSKTMEKIIEHERKNCKN